MPILRKNAVPCPCSCNHYSCLTSWVDMGRQFFFRKPSHVPVPAIITVAAPVGWTWDANFSKESRPMFCNHYSCRTSWVDMGRQFFDSGVWPLLSQSVCERHCLASEISRYNTGVLFVWSVINIILQQKKKIQFG
ncbi:hypothetical protein AVEN_267731-1 [Araneus ventricosus]|uniref:Uncharacterized protein n=1 Tax=Araneus ventricosus TaxID=182803 RepID=A0A4Y2CVF8_ARAVE|nr:hypothetical protein AVEN_267731-1 [Araneus ventricosus]